LTTISVDKQRRDLLKVSARKEFEQYRYLDDPEEITRQMMVARDALMQVQERLHQKAEEIVSPGKIVTPKSHNEIPFDPRKK